MKVLKVVTLKSYHKTLGTSVINSPMSPSSLILISIPGHASLIGGQTVDGAELHSLPYNSCPQSHRGARTLGTSTCTTLSLLQILYHWFTYYLIGRAKATTLADTLPVEPRLYNWFS